MSRTIVHQWHFFRVVTLTASWAVVCCFFGLALSTAQASIMLPEAKAVDIEKLLADTNEGAGSTSTRRADETPVENPTEAELARLMAAAFSPVEGSTSSTSTSSSGGSGTNVCPLSSSSAANLSDAMLVAWLNGEQRFTLPTPPGNQLLRPPRV